MPSHSLGFATHISDRGYLWVTLVNYTDSVWILFFPRSFHMILIWVSHVVVSFCCFFSLADSVLATTSEKLPLGMSTDHLLQPDHCLALLVFACSVELNGK